MESKWISIFNTNSSSFIKSEPSLISPSIQIKDVSSRVKSEPSGTNPVSNGWDNTNISPDLRLNSSCDNDSTEVKSEPLSDNVQVASAPDGTRIKSEPLVVTPNVFDELGIKDCHVSLQRFSFRDMILLCHGFNPFTYTPRRRLKWFCPFCGLMKNNLSSMSRHSERKHSLKKTLYCKICGKNFYFTYELLGHDRQMHNNKGYNCHYCSRILRSEEGLKIHEATHTGEKNYECNFCDKRFNCKYGLKVHTRHHTGERPFACQFCLFKTFSSSGLIAHERLHTSEQPYKCSYCPKAFALNAGRKAHERRKHTGERPFGCEHCPTRFFSKSDYNAHKWLHRPGSESPYPCTTCGRGFARRDAMLKHVATCSKKSKLPEK